MKRPKEFNLLVFFNASPNKSDTTANPEPIGDTMDKVPFSKARYNNKVPIKLMTLIPAIPNHPIMELLSMCGDCVSINISSKSEEINGP